MTWRRVLLVTGAVAAALVVPTPAVGAADDVVVLRTDASVFRPGTSNQGWWSDRGVAQNGNANYLVGLQGGKEFRNFFTFDTAPVDGTITAATLVLPRHAESDVLPARYALFDVTTDPVTLNRNRGIDAAIFHDLGTGVPYGGHEVTASSRARSLSFPLNAEAVAALNAAPGDYVSVGGRLVEPAPLHKLFAGTNTSR